MKTSLALLMLALLPVMSAVPLACVEDGQPCTSILSIIPDRNYFHFSISTQDGKYNLDRKYDWECTSGMAEVVFDSKSGTAGTINVTFRDGEGRVVFDQSFVESGNLFIRRDTLAASPGIWSVHVNILNFEGSAAISVTAK